MTKPKSRTKTSAEPDLLDDILRMLENREDIALYEFMGSRIGGVQLRRVWRRHIYNPDSMSPHEREFWEYYGQSFIIEEPRPDKHGKLLQVQTDLAEKFGRVGSIVIFAKSLDDVIDQLGPEPEDIGEYIARLQTKPREPTRQPHGYFSG